jgi:hypothetical protein
MKWIFLAFSIIELFCMIGFINESDIVWACFSAGSLVLNFVVFILFHNFNKKK